MAKTRRQNLIQLRVTDEEKEMVEVTAEMTGQTNIGVILTSVRRVYVEASMDDRRKKRRQKEG